MSRKSYNVVSIIYYQTSSPKMNSRIWKVWAAPRKTQIFALLGGLIMWSFVNQTLNSTHFEYTDYILRLHWVFTAQTEFSDYSRWRYIGLGNQFLFSSRDEFFSRPHDQNPVKYRRWSILQKQLTVWSY